MHQNMKKKRVSNYAQGLSIIGPTFKTQIRAIFGISTNIFIAGMKI